MSTLRKSENAVAKQGDERQVWADHVAYEFLQMQAEPQETLLPSSVPLNGVRGRFAANETGNGAAFVPNLTQEFEAYV